MFSFRGFKQMKPAPPTTLSKEYSRVWIGWCMIGDREVAREAAAKGIYISLALQFIATRKEWDYSDVERWFNSEILAWSYQLLEQKQIYKASHILLNIGIDPNQQFTAILCETTSKTIRDYIADHLYKHGNLEPSLFKLWKFILAIEESNNILFNNVFDDVSQISITKIEQKSSEWKSNIATTIFFKSQDLHLTHYLTAESVWTNALLNERLDVLKLWINIYFSKDLQYNCKTRLEENVYEELKNLFLIWEITNDMIDEIRTKSVSDLVQNFLLNELSKFGIFVEEEKQDVTKMLSRLSQMQNIQNIFTIFEEPSCNQTIHEFYEKLYKFCIEHKLYEVLSECSTDFSISPTLVQSSKEVSLWLRKKQRSEILTDDSLKEYTITAVEYFADNIEEYLANNPIILIAIILFTKGLNFNDIIVHKKDLIINNTKISSDKILSILNLLPTFKKFITKSTSEYQEDCNLYDLLKDNSNLMNALQFRQKEEEIPHFRNHSYCEKYGFLKNINYIYYIKQSRPSKAAKLFVLEHFNSRHISNETKQEVLHLVLQKPLNFEIWASGIAFLEMIGEPADELRTIVSSIDALHKSGLYSSDEIQSQFANLKTNSKDILLKLETIISQDTTESNFINVLKNYELVLNFARFNSLELPEKLLIYCALENLWLQFIIFVQVFNYPLEQVLKLTENFCNKQIIEHIHHALSNEIELTVNQSLTSSIISTSSDIDLNLSENFFEFNTKSNLLKVLIKCHKSGDPPTTLLQACQVYKYPLFAILATCYEPDSVVISWLTWLSVSANIEVDVENYSISPKAVSNLLENVVHKKYIRTLLESFEIFLSENPLRYLIEFLHNCTQLKFDLCTDYLTKFEKSVGHVNYNAVLINNDWEYTFLINNYWLIDTALKLIFASLESCFQSKLHQIKFLNIISTHDFNKNTSINMPDFCAISNLLESFSSNVKINLSTFLNTDKRRREIAKCIEDLVKKQQFKDALMLAKFENVFKEYVLCEEWFEKFTQHPTNNFWEECDEAFKLAEVSPVSTAEFYLICCTNLEDCSEKYKALKLAYKWLKLSNYLDESVENIEFDVWSKYFALDDTTLKQSCFDKNETNYLLSEINEKSKTNTKFEHELTNEQLRHLEETVGKILDSGDIIEALRLSKIFNYKSDDILILLTCFELAEGKLKPHELNADQRLLLLSKNKNIKSGAPRRRHFKSTRSSTESVEITASVTLIQEYEDPNTHNTLTLIEALTDRLKYGNNIACRILMCYRISININKPYQEIVKCEDSATLLNTALTNNCNNKLEVVHDVIIIFKWDNSLIFNFIFEELINAVNIFSKNSNLELILMWDLNLDIQFHLVLQLCPESNSLLGKKLLTLINSLEQEQIMLTVELLIRAHDCFNSFCNMKGIASVLRKAQTVTSTLVNLKEWKLMVRLLTGIGRYSEMNYVFQILRENDQFECLLRRNLRYNNGLKVALLKYLKKHCPKNQELYRIVALHFNLFSEVAELWENEAIEMIDNVIEIAKLEIQNQNRKLADFVLFSNSDSTILCLNKAMTNFSHAAEYHLHGVKLMSAMHAAKQAELLALQINLLKTSSNNSNVKCILKLTTNQIMDLICNDLRFTQAMIVVDSYNYQADWGAILFNQCILKANLDYLEDYLISKPLTNTLAQDLTRRFLSEKNLSPPSINAMKEIIKKLTSVHMKYRLASELGFGDVIQSFLNGSQLAYLKDTVWKKGYKQL